ncbi:MAG: RNA polymerase sigma factor [Planctomycetes bacterium]|nr:RNA polymerase sigma factor [Planctomycetota bacterium]
MNAPVRPAKLQDLLDALSAANTGAQSTSIEELRDRLHTIARGQMSPGDGLRRVLDSEDLTQEALLDVIRNAHLFRGNTWPEFHAFLDAVLRRRKADLARHHARLRRRISRREGSIDELEIPSAAPSPASVLFRTEDLLRLRRLVDELPSDAADALRLKLADHEYPAIAAQLGISEVAARKRVSRAIAELKRTWKDGDGATAG